MTVGVLQDGIYGLYCEVLALLGLRQYGNFCLLSLHATGYISNP